MRQCLLSIADPDDLEREISVPKTGLLQQFECILESDVNELCGFILRSRFLLTLVRFNFLAYRANKQEFVYQESGCQLHSAPHCKHLPVCHLNGFAHI